MTVPAPTPAVAGDVFTSLPGQVAQHARARPDAPCLRVGERQWSWREFDATASRVAAALQRDGVGPGGVVAVCAASSLEYLAVFVGTLRCGAAVAPLAPGSTPKQLAAMAADAGASHVFVDAGTAGAADPADPADPVVWPAAARVLRLDDTAAWVGWLATRAAEPTPVTIDPLSPFNLIYSSGTTGTPKGIVQPHAMRWAHVQRAAASGYGPGTVALIATPLYSNTTLVCLVPTLAYGGMAVLMPKFDAERYLELAQRHRATHTMLVPVQYQRLMAHPQFHRFDLSAFTHKFCTSAPFHAELKADVLARWPGGLTEYYGMTEGGGTCILQAHLHPDKLHTVGQPAEGHDVRLIDAQGVEVPAGASGEVIGRSPGMMSGYHRLPEATAAAEWHDAQGNRYIRTGDIGRFDADGFLILHDRVKDMLISGGFNIYPSDLEAVLRRHPAVADCAVVGVPSAEWGETPVAFVVWRGTSDGIDGRRVDESHAGKTTTADELRTWANAQLAKTQRLHAVRVLAELPRSAIGKVLKRELRAAFRP